MRRALLAACALALLVSAGTAGAAGQPRFAGVDTSAYPLVRATVVLPGRRAAAPRLTENGRPVVGYEAANLGRAKSVVLAVDHSQSMQGQALKDASRAARAFVARKPRADRIGVVAVGERAIRMTGFSSSTIDADSALRSIEVDEVRGTALYDAVVLSSAALADETLSARVLILLTDGQEVSSSVTLKEAIAAAREARVAVYPVAIESPSFVPGPLRRLAAETGGRYAGAANSRALTAVYASIAAELRRTWQLEYTTSARPGDRLELAAAGAKIALRVPGSSAAVTGGSSFPGGLGRVGPAVIALLVGALVLLAVLALMRAPSGTSLRRRISPHLGKPERTKRGGRGGAQERFATASTIMRATEATLGHLKVWHSLHRLLERADVPMRTVELLYLALGSGFLVAILFVVAGASSLVVLLALALGALLPIAYVWHKAKRRINAIETQLPDLLITLAASLKAGHSFRQGIQSIVDEDHPPASKEFKRVLTETQLGRPMDDALADMANRLGSKNLSFVVTAVTIQRQVGGSLAGIFDMVAEAVRNRQQFARKIRSLTAMGRMSAYVLVGIPIFLAGAITIVNPAYMDPLYHSPTGHKLILMGVVMMLLGTAFLKKIVSFKG